jgi:hypothetical protein
MAGKLIQMPPLTELQSSFLRDHLGVVLPDAEAVGALTPVWQDAKDAADDQLRRLSDILRKSNDPDVVEVADEVETLLQPVRVKMLNALMEADKTPDAATARKTALDIVAETRSWLGSDGRIGAVDDNPWGVPVSVASILGAALDRIEGHLNT